MCLLRSDFVADDAGYDVKLRTDQYVSWIFFVV